jgi:DNA-binding transcriptional LysR family regulator
VAHCTRLRHVTVPQAWSRWSETYGVEDMDPLSGPQFDQFQTIRAVQAGMGVALVPRCLVQDEINAGLVSEPCRSTACSATRATGCATPRRAPT